MGNDMPEEDRPSALLVRDAMERTVAELPFHDLVPGAVAQGRRRKARARLAIVAGIVCVVGAVVLGSVTLPVGGGGRTTVRPAASATPEPEPEPTPYRTPVHIEPTSDEESSMADLPVAERERREEFQQRAAVLLDKLLPDAVGLIRPVDLEVRRYQGETEDGKVFPVIFSVRPSGEDSGPKSCPSDPGALKGGSCEQATLPGGIKATAYRMISDLPETTATLVTFSYGDSDVSLTVNPDEDATTSAPVTMEKLVATVSDPRFLDLVRYADENPMQERQTSIAGG
ncbi:hypothetical protein [Streptomyces sp. GQFP]|uniref:hypothetical protein n=1 Tax=Streptomyces sp. GQFP TaxID=2907545 RepID=UPI001F361C11|nr:hypothetical protein [Streptomyces sp. GQFP]UIX33052.1 hypothetical protein LUX31_25225 [Streptomyces sp. GQFP]